MEQQAQMALMEKPAAVFRRETLDTADLQDQAPMTDEHAFPMAFVLLPSLVGTLLWLLTMLSHVT